jgi:hypothetical protein
MAAGVTARDRPLTVAEYHRLVEAGSWTTPSFSKARS